MFGEYGISKTTTLIKDDFQITLFNFLDISKALTNKDSTQRAVGQNGYDVV